MHPSTTLERAAPAGSPLLPLLDAAQAQAPDHGGGLSNHLPMALQALQSLGAPVARLQAFAHAHSPRRVAGAGDVAAAAHWRRLRQDWAARLARDGQVATLRQALPWLMPGVGGGAFHGLIRCGHALQAGHAGELASALAYWQRLQPPPQHAAPRPPTPPAAPRSPASDLPGWLAAVQALAPPDDADAAAPRIATRMAAWSRAPGFAAVAGSLRLDDDPATLIALARHAAALYAGSGDFTVLHVVTACRAMAVLAPLQADGRAALHQFSVAVAAGLRASGLDELCRPAPPGPAWPWPRIIEAAIASDDEHAAKLTQACRDLQRLDRDGAAGPWAAAATRVLPGAVR